MLIDVQDGGVAYSSFGQENKNLMAIRSLIAVGKVASFVVPSAGNKVAMSASSNTMEASIAV